MIDQVWDGVRIFQPRTAKEVLSLNDLKIWDTNTKILNVQVLL